ncbi:hypothetical protein [Natronorubrum halophilum]|nr:hypothetical protein [Natronorubrum halophilum]
MIGRLVGLFAVVLLALFLLLGPAIADATTAGLCGLFESIPC